MGNLLEENECRTRGAMQLGLVNRTVLVIYSYGIDATCCDSCDTVVGPDIFECSIHPQVCVYSYIVIGK